MWACSWHDAGSGLLNGVRPPTTDSRSRGAAQQSLKGTVRTRCEVSKPVVHFETHRTAVSGGPSRYAQAVLVRRVLAIAPVPVTVVALILPWSVSGTSARSAFALVHALEGVSSALPGWERIGLRAAYALPVIAACALAAAVLGRIRLSALLGVVLGAVVVAASIAAIVQLGASARLGPWVGGIGCAIAMAIGFTVMVCRTTHRAR